ncbi:hypothetical protein [Deinococcus aerophilus]|uniref:hypothetical protein n=1 Tax=Deinococcus aerophilus TaxID=522488 RepID=UPI001669056B|nr:hypothetical protein [Deinococcus aerophilus]
MFLALSLTATLPGAPTTPAQLGTSISLRSNEEGRLVLIRGAQTSGVETYKSKSGLTHLRFRLTSGGASYAAIAYENQWTPALRRALEAGRVDAAGVWETFQGAPSFTLKYVVAPLSTATTTAARNLLRIRDAFVPEGSVQKITRAQNVTFTFLVGSEIYQGVMYAGSWNSAALDLLLSGRVTLYGHWETFEGRPSFVTTRVTP